MSYDPAKHHRRSIRLKKYDYSAPGSYFVTICTRYREKIFGEILNGVVTLSRAGHIIQQSWDAIPRHTPHVVLDAAVIMPDHFHGIVVIHERREDQRNHTKAGTGTIAGSLPAIIQNFKAVSARRINTLQGTRGQRVWQEDYYERIIRDQHALERIRRYIADNPDRWRGDMP